MNIEQLREIYLVAAQNRRLKRLERGFWFVVGLAVIDSLVIVWQCLR